MAGDERDFIRRHLAPLVTHPGAAGLSDDAAVLAPPAGQDLVLTTDAVVAGVHMFADDAPEDVARKALHVNLSDLAAKGADPYVALMTLSLPATLDDDWIGRFCRALGREMDAARCALIGGDTVRAPTLGVSITAIGTVPRGEAVRRHTAQVGDAVLVSGSIGRAALGLLARRGEIEAPGPLDAYLRPTARVALAPVIRRHASAAMDVSDGLVGDLDALLEASGVTATVRVSDIPLGEEVVAHPDLRDLALTGGDDYEILACVPPDRVEPAISDAAEVGETLTVIGRVEAGRGTARFVGPDGRATAFARRSFSHL